MSFMTPILTTSPEISAGADAVSAKKAAKHAAKPTTLMRYPPVPSQSKERISPSYAEIGVQLVGILRQILVADHIDDATVLDDVMAVGKGRGEMEILLDQ